MQTAFCSYQLENHAQGQVVDAAVKGVCQSEGDLNRGVGVVALADIHDSRKASDRTEIQVVEAVFAAGQGQDHGVRRSLSDKFRIVIPARTASVTASHQEEMADRAGFHRVHDLCRQRKGRYFSQNRS